MKCKKCGRPCHCGTPRDSYGSEVHWCQHPRADYDQREYDKQKAPDYSDTGNENASQW